MLTGFTIGETQDILVIHGVCVGCNDDGDDASPWIWRQRCEGFIPVCYYAAFIFFQCLSNNTAAASGT